MFGGFLFHLLTRILGPRRMRHFLLLLRFLAKAEVVCTRRLFILFALHKRLFGKFIGLDRQWFLLVEFQLEGVTLEYSWMCPRVDFRLRRIDSSRGKIAFDEVFLLLLDDVLEAH